MRPSAPLPVGILVIVAFFADIAVTGTLQPFFIDEVIQADVEWVGAAITVQYACATLGLFLTGLLADTIGLRRTVLLVAVANVVLLNLVGWTRSVAALLVVRGLLGLVSTYALGLTWVASLAPPARLARWMSATVCFAQLAVMAGGFVAGAMRGQDLFIACAVVSVAPALAVLILLCTSEVPAATPSSMPPVMLLAPAAAPAAPSAPPSPPSKPSPPRQAQTGLWRALRTRYFWGVAVAPLVQGCFIGGVAQSLAPLVLRTTHGWDEASVARLFQISGLCALLAHAALTPYLASVSWRHRATQALAVLVAATSLAYGVLGERHSALALALPVVGFVATAVSLGVVNVMVALLARAVAPEALGALTGLTRCLFTLGYCVLPASLVPLLKAGGLLAPCLLIAALFVLKAALLQLATRLPIPDAPAESTVATAAGSTSGVGALQGGPALTAMAVVLTTPNT